MSLGHGASVVQDGLICHVDPANPKCNQGTSVYLDITGNGNDMSMNYGTYDPINKWWVSEQSDPSKLSFTISDSPSITSALSTTTGGWCIEEVVRIDDTTYPEAAAGTTVSGPAYTSGVKGFDWNHGEYITTGYLDVGMSDGTQTSSYGQKVNLNLSDYTKIPGNWLHRHIYWNRSTQKVGVWYNGIFQDEADINLTDSLYDGGGLLVGELYGWMHDGARSSFRIYNRVLTDDEIKQNFEATRGRYGI